MLNPSLKISIVVLNWNGMKDTLACLESLKKLSYSLHEIIVVDNGSTDGSVPAIREAFPHCKLIETGANLGFAGGNNAGIEYALAHGADYILLLNNDTVVAPDLLECFIETFNVRPDAGLLGAKILRFDQRDTLDHFGGMWDRKSGTFSFVGLGQKDGADWQESQEIDYACGAGLMIKRAVFEQVGLLEPRFFLIWEESDFCFRAKKAGFKTLTCPKAKIWHKVSASFVGKPHSTYFWWRNRLLWIERNLPVRERWSLTLRVLLPEVVHMLKIRVLKKMQLLVTRLIRPRSDLREKELKLLKNRAALSGVRDYLLRRFGNGPSWIYKK